MKLTPESKILVGIGVVTGLLLTIAAIAFSGPGKPVEKSVLIDQSTHVKGNIDAQTWLVEFSDFQCPACQIFSAAVEELTIQYPDTLLVAYRHYPLAQHPQAIPAARAAEAAGKQDKFFEMERFLFTNQASLSASFYKSAIPALDLNPDQFLRDSTDSGLLSKINTDKALGDKLRLQATPTFFLNGIKLDIGTPEELMKEVEKAILK